MSATLYPKGARPSEPQFGVFPVLILTRFGLEQPNLNKFGVLTYTGRGVF